MKTQKNWAKLLRTTNILGLGRKKSGCRKTEEGPKVGKKDLMGYSIQRLNKEISSMRAHILALKTQGEKTKQTFFFGQLKILVKEETIK